MDNNIDSLLEQISSDVPKVNPYLNNKIYNNAITKKSNNSISFFKKPLFITFASVLVFIVLIVGTINLANLPFYDKNGAGGSQLNSVYVPNLDPNMQNTVFIDYHYTVCTNEYSCITLIINNKINYQKIYIKNYGEYIENVKINNGDMEIKEVIIDNETFYEIVFNNSNTSIHYIDLCYNIDIFESKLEKNRLFEFILYIEEVDVDMGYGYQIEINEIYDLRDGNNI